MFDRDFLFIKCLINIIIVIITYRESMFEIANKLNFIYLVKRCFCRVGNGMDIV